MVGGCQLGLKIFPLKVNVKTADSSRHKWPVAAEKVVQCLVWCVTVLQGWHQTTGHCSAAVTNDNEETIHPVHYMVSS